jgi:predicted house-cleaning NTP pyrophosphatase (Maf/HAM1 superfamily)
MRFKRSTREDYQLYGESDRMRSKSYSNYNEIQAKYERGLPAVLRIRQNAKQELQQLQWDSSELRERTSSCTENQTECEARVTATTMRFKRSTREDFQLYWESDRMRSKSYINYNEIQAKYERGLPAVLGIRQNAKQELQQLQWDSSEVRERSSSCTENQTECEARVTATTMKFKRITREDFQLYWESDRMRSKSYSNYNEIQAKYERGVPSVLRFWRNASKYYNYTEIEQNME